MLDVLTTAPCLRATGARSLQLALIITAIATVPAGNAAAANFTVSVSAGSGTTQVSGTTDSKNESGSAAVAQNAESLTVTPTDFGIGSSKAEASAGPGTLKVWANASGTSTAINCCSGGQGGSSARATWNDVFVVRSDQFADGTTATLTARILIDGSFPLTTSGGFWGSTQSWSWNFGLAGLQWAEGTTVASDYINGSRTFGDGFGYRTYTANIVLGQGVATILDVTASAAASAGGFGGSFIDASTDLAHTVTWQGIDSLTVNGVAVSSFTALSATSGFDFRAGVRPIDAVPEPATWALLILGFGATGAASRRRRAGGFDLVAR